MDRYETARDLVLSEQRTEGDQGELAQRVCAGPSSATATMCVCDDTTSQLLFLFFWLLFNLVWV